MVSFSFLQSIKLASTSLCKNIFDKIKNKNGPICRTESFEMQTAIENKRAQ